MQTHYAEIVLVKVDPTGAILTDSESIGQNLRFTNEHRILPVASIPNSANYPDVRTYLDLEAASGFQPVQIAQGFVLTFKA